MLSRQPHIAYYMVRERCSRGEPGHLPELFSSVYAPIAADARGGGESVVASNRIPYYAFVCGFSWDSPLTLSFPRLSSSFETRRAACRERVSGRHDRIWTEHPRDYIFYGNMSREDSAVSSPHGCEVSLRTVLDFPFDSNLRYTRVFYIGM